MYGDIKLVTTEEQINKLVSEPNYHTRKHFTENLFGIEMKTKVAMNLGMTILDISKTLMYKSWYDYIKAKYGDRAKLHYIQILIVLLFIFLLKIFLKTLLVMLKDGLIHLTMMKMIKDLFQ